MRRLRVPSGSPSRRPATPAARRTTPYRTLAVCLAALAALALPAPAFGHAVLLSTSPERGAQLQRAPHQVTFEFNESVEASFGAVRVFDGEGDRVDDDELLRPGGRSDTVGVRLPRDLGPGTYTATYRVVSADSHPVSGGMVFVVGGGGESAVTVSDLLEEGDAGTATTVGFAVVRGLAYGAMALAIGGLLFVLAVWAPALRRLGDATEGWQEAAAGFARRASALIAAGVLVGVVTSVLGLAFQGAVAGGTSVWAALDPAVLDAVMETRFGTIWALRALLWLVLGLIVLWPRSPVRVPSLQPARLGADGAVARPATSPVLVGALAILAVAIGMTPGLSGHAGTATPAWLIVGADTVHVLAMCAWVGALVFLLAAVPIATRRLDGAMRTRVLAATLAGVSPIALVSVLALLATGIVQSVAHLEAVADLWETGFGRALLVKSALFVALVGIGAHHRRRGMPRLRSLAAAGEPPARAGVIVRRALRFEVALFAGVLAATSVLVASSPAAAGPGVLSERVTVGSAAVDVTVEPLRVGPNEMHFYLYDGTDGSRLELIEEMQVELSQPAKDIGPIPVSVSRAGPGHYLATRADIGVPGDWQLRLRLRLSKFDVYSARLPVEIR